MVCVSVYVCACVCVCTCAYICDSLYKISYNTCTVELILVFEVRTNSNFTNVDSLLNICPRELLNQNIKILSRLTVASYTAK